MRYFSLRIILISAFKWLYKNKIILEALQKNTQLLQENNLIKSWLSNILLAYFERKPKLHFIYRERQKGIERCAWVLMSLVQNLELCWF